MHLCSEYFGGCLLYLFLMQLLSADRIYILHINCFFLLFSLGNKATRFWYLSLLGQKFMVFLYLDCTFVHY